MKEPSDARKRTLALQARALKFSTGVLTACPLRFTNLPSETVWRQLVRAADSKIRMASLERHDRIADLEREAGELSAIFATIAMKVAARLQPINAGQDATETARDLTENCPFKLKTFNQTANCKLLNFQLSRRRMPPCSNP